MASSGAGDFVEDAESRDVLPQRQQHCRSSKKTPCSTSAASAGSEEKEVEEEQEDAPCGALVTTSWQPLGADQGKCGETPHSWCLVWCHERCHKPENMELRKSINAAAKEVDAALVCMRKANKFELWLDRAEHAPFALLTDWREAKPCIQTLSLQPPSNRPACTVLLCTMERQFERASSWAQALPPRADPVIVCRELSSPRQLLAILATRVKAALAQGTFEIRNVRTVPWGPWQPRLQAEHGTTQQSDGGRRPDLKAAATAIDEALPGEGAAQERDAQQNPSYFPTDLAEVPALGSASDSGTAMAVPSTGFSHHVPQSQPWNSPQVRQVLPAASTVAPTCTSPKAATPDAAHVSYSPEVPSSIFAPRMMTWLELSRMYPIGAPGCG